MIGPVAPFARHTGYTNRGVFTDNNSEKRGRIIVWENSLTGAGSFEWTGYLAQVSDETV
jgi:hypothetical protein